MQIRVHGNHMKVPPDLKSLAEEKVGRAVRIFDDPLYADVEFTEEQNPRIANRYRVEITSSAAGQIVRVEASESDGRSALELAVGKFERQLRRLKERLIGRHRRSSEKHLNTIPLAVEDNLDELRIERVKQFVVKPMTPTEAAQQMDLLGHSFYFFLDADTERYGVVYRRRGGSIGLIGPE